MRLPSGRELVERRLSGLDRMALRMELKRAETSRDRFAVAYAVVGLAGELGTRPRFVLAELLAYGEWVCADLEASEGDVEGVLEAVLRYAEPVLVPPGPTLEAVEEAGKGAAPPAGA